MSRAAQESILFEQPPVAQPMAASGPVAAAMQTVQTTQRVRVDPARRLISSDGDSDRAGVSIAVHKGRGALSNRAGRYDSWQHEPVDDGWRSNRTTDADPTGVKNCDAPGVQAGCNDAAIVDFLDAVDTNPARRVSIDNTRRILARNNSPDVPFDRSINPYRGCEHGCVYCFARPTHTYLGFSAGLDFETKIVMKPRAAELLRETLAKPGYQCDVIAMGTNTDPYQPLEREQGITREILGVLSEANHPVSFVTKSALICRDIDLLASMAERSLAQVWVSVTSLDNGLSAKLEPRAAAPHKRLATIRRLADAGIPVGVLVAPVIPFLTDGELERIAERAHNAGASAIGTVMLRLPHEVAELMQEWLAEHTPAKARHVMSLVRQMRGGKDYDARWGDRQRGTGVYANMLAQRLSRLRDKLSLSSRLTALDCEQFSVPSEWRDGSQLALF